MQLGSAVCAGYVHSVVFCAFWLVFLHCMLFAWSQCALDEAAPQLISQVSHISSYNLLLTLAPNLSHWRLLGCGGIGGCEICDNRRGEGA